MPPSFLTEEGTDAVRVSLPLSGLPSLHLLDAGLGQGNHQVFTFPITIIIITSVVEADSCFCSGPRGWLTLTLRNPCVWPTMELHPVVMASGH